jgi:hypothetical protein
MQWRHVIKQEDMILQLHSLINYLGGRGSAGVEPKALHMLTMCALSLIYTSSPLLNSLIELLLFTA